VAGTDGVHPELIKHRVNKLLDRIYEPVRQIWENEWTREEWKETITVPIHKRWDRDKCENYRGIALGNAAYNILSNIILEKIKPYIENIKGDYQMDSQMKICNWQYICNENNKWENLGV
jgi:hypothetical protein